MRDLKTINLRFTTKEYDAVSKDKKEGESWEAYIIRKTITEAKKV